MLVNLASAVCPERRTKVVLELVLVPDLVLIFFVTDLPSLFRLVLDDYAYPSIDFDVLLLPVSFRSSVVETVDRFQEH